MGGEVRAVSRGEDGEIGRAGARGDDLRIGARAAHGEGIANAGLNRTRVGGPKTEIGTTLVFSEDQRPNLEDVGVDLQVADVDDPIIGNAALKQGEPGTGVTTRDTVRC